MSLKAHYILLSFFFFFSLQSCGPEDSKIYDYAEQKIVNDSTLNPWNNKGQETKSLKILAIGNSFTDDGTAYLPSLIQKAGIPNVTIAKMVVGGTSLQFHYTHAVKNDTVYAFSVSTGDGFRSQGKKTFSECLSSETWDYVIVQQLSNLSGMYHTYQPYLNDLIKIIYSYQPNVGIGWQMTWAYSTNSTHSGFYNYEKSQTKMHEAIADAVNQMKTQTGVSLIIPTGMVIQELRGTHICNDLELTRDGYHLDYGAGRYAAACTWFETFIYPIYNVSVVNNTYRVNKGNIPVTDEVALLCQTIAASVVNNYYN